MILRSIQNMDNQMVYGYVQTPIGRLLMAGNDDGLQILDFQNKFSTKTPLDQWQRDDQYFSDTASQLTAYFNSELREFDVKLNMIGTQFRQHVWHALVEIPYGETRSYVDIAHRIGNPKASRAVGLANGANPIPIIVPCHRVIGKNKSLVGYGGGLEIKKFLLILEQAEGRLF